MASPGSCGYYYVEEFSTYVSDSKARFLRKVYCLNTVMSNGYVTPWMQNEWLEPHDCRLARIPLCLLGPTTGAPDHHGIIQHTSASPPHPIPTDTVNTQIHSKQPPNNVGFVSQRAEREHFYSVADEILNLHSVARLQRKRTQKALVSIIALQTGSTMIPSVQTAMNSTASAERWITERGVPSPWEQLKGFGLISSALFEHTVDLMVLCAVYSAVMWPQSLPSPLCVTPLLGANRSRPWPPRSPVHPRPASRWALLMSPSCSSGVGLFFPGLEGARGGQRGLLAGSAPGRGLGMGQGWETHQGELKITLFRPY